MIHALIFGAYGAGKTGSLASWPRPRILDFDGRAITLLSRLNPVYDWQANIVKFKENVINSMGVIKDDGHFAFDDACRAVDRWASKNERDKWDTLAVDTGTTLADLANGKAIILNKKMGLSETYAKAVQYNVTIPRIQDYGSERSLMEQFVRMCVNEFPDKNFLFLCHEKEVSSESGSVTAITPLLTGRGAVAIPTMFGEVWNLRVEGAGDFAKRYLQTQRDGIRGCRSDLGLPNKTAPDYPSIIAALGGINAYPHP